LAVAFNIEPARVSDIRRGRTYARVGGPRTHHAPGRKPNPPIDPCVKRIRELLHTKTAPQICAELKVPEVLVREVMTSVLAAPDDILHELGDATEVQS
jgi:hypothetical protein